MVIFAVLVLAMGVLATSAMSSAALSQIADKLICGRLARNDRGLEPAGLFGGDIGAGEGERAVTLPGPAVVRIGVAGDAGNPGAERIGIGVPVVPIDGQKCRFREKTGDRRLHIGGNGRPPV